MTAAIILSLTFYFEREIGRTLRNGIIRLAEREVVHLAEVTQYAVSSDDDLAVDAAVRNVAVLDNVIYVHVLDSEGMVLQSSDTALSGTNPDDEGFTAALGNNDSTKPLRRFTETADGSIYDFSLPVFDKVFGKTRIATVRMGFSDKEIVTRLQETRQVIIIIAVVFVTMAVFGAHLLSAATTAPLKKLSKGVEIIGTGNLQYQIEVSSRDEIGQLADEFNSMTVRLQEAQHNEIESRIMQEQLDVAREIQEGLNPLGFYNKKGIQIKGFTNAAKGVGGDYFDYIDIDEFRVGALISDVSGKGIPASLVMVMIRTVFVSAIHQDPRKIQCAGVVSAINSSLSADFAIDKFATLFFMIYDRKRQMLAFSNAGHGPLFCYRAAKKACTVTKIEGVPIGIMEDSDYVQCEVPFKPGDNVVLYTDGVTDKCGNNEKEEYGKIPFAKNSDGQPSG